MFALLLLVHYKLILKQVLQQWQHKKTEEWKWDSCISPSATTQAQTIQASLCWECIGPRGPHSGRQLRQWVGGWRREGLRGGWDSTPILAQVGWRWLRSALSSKKANECSSCPNIILSERCTIEASHQCFLTVCACTVCVCGGVYVCANVWPWQPHLTCHPGPQESKNLLLVFLQGQPGVSERHSSSQF